MRSRIGHCLLPLIGWLASSTQAADLALPDAPLNLIAAVEPNVVLVIDDSGSMDWEVLIPGAHEGIGGGALSGYYVLPSDNNGLDLAHAPNHYFTISDEDNMAAQGVSGLGIWRLKNSDFNRMYYNPRRTYNPWVGEDGSGAALYTDANPSAAPVDPNNPGAGVFDLTASLSFVNYSDHLATDYPETIFPATYYLWQDTDIDGLVDAGDGHSKIQITPAVNSYATGPQRTDCASVPVCTYAEEIQNFANWYSYHRKRNYVVRAAIGQIIQHTQGIQLGLSLYNAGMQQTPLSLGNASNKTTLLGHAYNTAFICTSEQCPGTPARRALARVGEIFASASSPIAAETQGGRCQQNFTLMLTDGYRNGDLTPAQQGLYANEDGDNNSAYDGGTYADSYAQTLADIAMHLYENDLQPSISNDVPIISAHDNATHQHLNTYTLAFGVSGLLDPFGTLTPDDATDTDSADPVFAWPQPIPSTPSTIDDLWHAAYNGRGAYLNAMQPNGVLGAFGQMVSSVLDRVASGSSVALNSTALGSDTLLFQSRFDSADWHGELWAYPINPDGSLGDIAWDANCKLSGGYCAATGSTESAQHWDSGRVILTSTPPGNAGGTGTGVAFRWPSNPAAPGSNEITLEQVAELKTDPLDGSLDNDNIGMDRLHFIRGADIPGMRERAHLLGDLAGSKPTYVGAPAFAYPDSLEAASYAAFAEAQANRPPVVYVGANDGMLHGFNASASGADAGKEVLAYVPSPVYANLSALSHPDYGGLPGHRFYVNGSPTMGDVYTQGAWKTLLAGSLGKGGQGIYALDITRPGDFSEHQASQIVQWEFTDALDGDLGYTFGRPAIIRLANGKWAVAIGNGYNNTKADGAASSSGNAMIYLLDAADGSLMRKFDTHTGMAEDPTGQQRPNGIATLTPVDIDADHMIDYIYAPDLFGNVWKLDVRASNAASWGFAYGPVTSPLPFFRARNPTNQAQPITTAVEASLHPTGNGQLVYFGTGQYLQPVDVGQAGQQTQTFYALWDRNQTSWVNIQRDHLLAQSIVQEANYASGINVRITSNHAMRWYTGSGTPGNTTTQGYLGWYLDLYNTQAGNTANNGERVVSDPILRNGRIIFTTLSPSADPCDLGGASWLMEIDAASGARLNMPAFDLNGDGLLNAADKLPLIGDDAVISGLKSTAGILSTPTILQNNHSGYAGASDAQRAGEIKFISTSSGAIQTILQSQPASRVGRQSWRQIK